MSTAHTPGPWVAELGSNGSFAIEADGRGITSRLLVIAGRNEHPLLAKQMHANARLIAAAPDLLAFVAAYLDDYKSEDGMYDPKHYAKRAAELIAKATGDAA